MSYVGYQQSRGASLPEEFCWLVSITYGSIICIQKSAFFHSLSLFLASILFYLIRDLLLRWTSTTLLQRISCPGRYTSWCPRDNQPSLSSRAQFRSSSYRGRDFQNDYFTHSNRCASKLSIIFLSLFTKCIRFLLLGTKFVLLTSLHDVNAESLLQKVYETYADMGMKNPFHTPEMPIRSDKFDSRIGALLGANPPT